MNRFQFFVLAALLLAAPALADPGSSTWTKFGSTQTVSRIQSGQTAQMVFTAGATNSVLLEVAATADICFDPDVLTSGGTARITAKRALTTAGSDDAAITVPAIPFDGSNCRQIEAGPYWIQVDTAATVVIE